MVMGIRFVHNRLQFSERKSGVEEQVARRAEGPTRNGVRLDPIGAVMKLFADGFARILQPVNLPAGPRQSYSRNSQIIRARRNDSPRRNLQPGAVEEDPVDRVADIDAA